MRRDGNNPSIWQDFSPYSPATQSESHPKYDVAIVGGGMTGIVTALHLQKAGKKCIVLEAHNIGFGTTGGTTAHINTLLDTPYTTIGKNFGDNGPKQVAKAVADAILLIEDHIRDYSISCDYSRSPAYLFSQDDQETEQLQDIFEASRSAGLDIELTQEIPIPVRFVKAVRVADQAKFHPLKYLFAIASAFEELGGHIHTNTMVNDVVEKDGQLTITGTSGSIISSHMVYATHIPPGINLLHLRCAPWRSYAMAVKLSESKYPDGLIYDMKDPYHYYRTQIIDGEPYLIVGGKDHKTGVPDPVDAFLSLRAHVENIFDVEKVTHQWSSQYYEPADGLPYIGLLPGNSERFYVATGFGGNGMVYSHVAAREIASKILSQESLYDNLFSPSRIKPVAGFKNFVNHNAEVAKHFIGKFFPAASLEALAGIAPGEGKIVNFEDDTIALAKDAEGKLHAIAPACTHMKCHVTWNRAEQSWDCPCHGARYSIDGEVLNGPANQNLEAIPLADNADRSQQNLKILR